MVEINNQRKAFLSISWHGQRELITDVRKPEITWLWRHCRRRAIYWLLRSPSQTCHAKPKASNQQAPDATSFFPVGGMPTASSLAWKTSLRKVRTLWHCSRLRRGALPMIDRGDIRQAIDRCSNIWASLPGAVLVSSSIRLTAWLQNSKKRAERSERLMYEQSHRSYLALVICIIVCLSLNSFNHYRINADPGRATKMPENWSWRTRQCGMQMRQRDVAALDAKYTKELADAKAENDALRDDVCPWSSVGCTSKQSVSQCVLLPPAWIMQPPPDWQTPRWTGLFHPQRLIPMQKPLEGTQKYINEQCR